MPIGTIIVLLQAVSSLIPAIPEVIAGIETAIGLIQSGQAPTAAQWASLDAALLAAHTQLQAQKEGQQPPAAT